MLSVGGRLDIATSPSSLDFQHNDKNRIIFIPVLSYLQSREEWRCLESCRLTRQMDFGWGWFDRCGERIPVWVCWRALCP